MAYALGDGVNWGMSMVKISLTLEISYSHLAITFEPSKTDICVRKEDFNNLCDHSLVDRDRD